MGIAPYGREGDVGDAGGKPPAHRQADGAQASRRRAEVVAPYRVIRAVDSIKNHYPRYGMDVKVFYGGFSLKLT